MTTRTDELTAIADELRVLAESIEHAHNALNEALDQPPSLVTPDVTAQVTSALSAARSHVRHAMGETAKLAYIARWDAR